MLLIGSGTGVLTYGLGMVVILSVDICSCFIGWVFCSFVSVALSGSKEGMMAVYCLPGNLLGYHYVWTLGFPGKMCFSLLGTYT